MRAVVIREHGGPEVLRLEDAQDYAEQLRGRPIVLAVDDLDTAPSHVVHKLAQLLRQYVTLEGEPVLLLFSSKHLSGPVQDLVQGIESGVPAESVQIHALDRKASPR